MLFPGPGGPLIVTPAKNRAKRILHFTHRRVSGIGNNSNTYEVTRITRSE